MKIDNRMEDAVFVQMVTYILVIVEKMENSNLILLHVKGYSQNEQSGIPFLEINRTNDENLNTGLMELNFMVTPSTTFKKKEKLEWEIKTVYNLDELPKNLKAVKIIAAYNADIAIPFRK